MAERDAIEGAADVCRFKVIEWFCMDAATATIDAAPASDSAV
jgi:hypothetical protein